MRTITTLAAAVGLVFAMSAPSFAATDFSAAKKKAPRVVDCQKAPSSRACKNKQSTELVTLDLAAAKKKVRAVDCKKAPSSRACKNKQLGT